MSRLWFLLIFFAVNANLSKAEVLPTYRVLPDSNEQMQKIADQFEVLRRLDQGFEVVVPLERQSEFLALAPSAKLLNPDLHAGLESEQKGYNLPRMRERLEAAVQRYPSLAKLATYGTSRGGRPEYFLTTGSDAENPDSKKPALMITAATHGDEVITVDVILGLIDRLLAGYGQDPRLTRMLDDVVIYWVPAVCVDSFVSRSRYVEGRDPNRDYAWPENPTRAPATQCIRDLLGFFHAHSNIVGTMDFHASGSMIMYPWAYTYERPDAAYDAKLDALTTYMAEANGFAHGSIAETIYVAKGSSADYYYWKTGAVATAVEVSRNFVAPERGRDDIVTENTESTWRFIESFIAP